MAAHPIAAVQNVSEKVADHMDAILQFFKPGAKIAVLVRQPDAPDQDFLLTNDTPEEIIAAVTRRKVDPKTVRGDV